MNHGTLQSILDQELNRAGDSGPLLTDILSRGQRAGYHRLEIWEAILAVFGKAEQQQRWQNWTRLDDREEIRLRLKVLLQCGSTDPVLNNFITFFFRASDPVLYQISAVIIGRELNRHQDLKDYFHSYCSKRGADPVVPVKLNGQRTRRRILLVQCAAEAWSEEESRNDFTLPEQPFEALNDSDISILFSAASMLLSHNRGGISAEYVKELLRQRFEYDRPVRDRNLIRNTGILLQRFQEAGEPAGDLFNLCFNRILTQYNRAASFASRLQALLLMDELMESSVHIGLSFSNTGGGDTPGGRFNRFLQCRLAYWSYMNRKTFDPGEDEFRRDSDSVVDRVFNSEPYENHEVQYRIFAEQVHLLGDLPRWRTFSLEERSYRAFFLTDYSLHPELFDDEELFLLLESNGYLEHLQDKKLREGELKNPLSPVMNRLLEAEPSVSRELFDPQLIHRLDSPGLLPALIPAEADSELHPVLADAVEHQIRFQLATDPSFHPDHFLYLLTIRRPHPKFFRYLAELSAGREYHHPQLGNWLLHETAQYLAGATSNGKRQTLPFWEVLSASHKTMNDAATSDDPFSTLNAVIRELKGTGTEKAQEGITLHDLLEIVQPGKGPWYCSGSPPMTAQPGRIVADQITRIAGRLEEKAGKLRPPTLGDSFLVSENVQSIVQILEQAGEEVVPLLGNREADALSRLTGRCIELLKEWEVKYSEAATLNSETEADTERRRAIAVAAIRAGHSSLQQALINMFIDTELERCSVQEDSDEVWLGTFKFLEWAADFGEMKAAADATALIWHTRLEEIWAGLAAEAMERNAEARVVQLVRNKAFAGIRKGKTGRDTLQQIKTWCFNRYDFHHAHQCNVEIGGSQMGVSFFRTLGEYAGHFARVWVALLLGVVFMFDFGDPWAELAEAGDFGGVLFAFVIGVAGAFLYVWLDLRRNTVHLRGDPFQWFSVFGRVSFFLIVTFLYTILTVCLFWYMFSETGQVVHGTYAPLHILSWTGFALFVGVFLGLIGRDD